MRRLTDRERLLRFMHTLGAAARQQARIYLTGGSSAVLLEWRDTTVDVDIEIEPEQDEILRSIAQLKESLDINVELASPALFIPQLPGWRERSRFIARARERSTSSTTTFTRRRSRSSNGVTRATWATWRR